METLGICSRLEQVFRSPLFEGNATLAALDEILIATGATRLDAECLENGTRIILCSSALAREREADGRKWTNEVDQDGGGTHDARGWWWETTQDVLPPGKAVRSSLAKSTVRLVVDTAESKFQLEIEMKRVHRLYFWFEARPDLTKEDIEEVLRALLRVCANKVSQSRPELRGTVSEIGGLSNLLRDDESHTHLRRILEDFDEWLRQFVPDSPQGVQSFSFLVEYFWVVKNPEPAPGGRDTFASVRPVFLDKQGAYLKEAFERNKHFFGADNFKDLDWIWNYRLDSNSLFGAFPADTRMSLFLRDWTREKIPTPPDSKRLAFKELTSTAQRLAADDAGLASEKIGNLLSVPVLVEDQTLFTATMILPDGLGAVQRAELASQIRRLGGIILRQARMYDALLKSKREKEHQARYSALTERAHLLSAINDVTRPIPTKVMNPIHSAVVEAKRLDKHDCLTVDAAARVLDACNDVMQEATRVVAETLRNEVPIDLSVVLARAIDVTPSSRQFILNPAASRLGIWLVLSQSETLTAIFGKVIEVVDRLADQSCSPTIDILQPDDYETARVHFYFTFPTCSRADIGDPEQELSHVRQVIEQMSGRMMVDLAGETGDASSGSTYVIEIPLFSGLALNEQSKELAV